MIRAALLGAVLVHPILFLVAFLWGYQLGSKDPWATPGTLPTFGWEGGKLGLNGVIYGYLITFGVAPLIVTVVGAGLSVGTYSVICLWASKKSQ